MEKTINRREDANCVICENKLFKAPTDKSWMEVRAREGICYDCVDVLHGVLDSMRENERKGKTNATARYKNR